MSGSRSPSPTQEPRSRSPTTAESRRTDTLKDILPNPARSPENVSPAKYRQNSRSPRENHRAKRKDAGFKWKEKRVNNTGRVNDKDDAPRRGYRDQYRTRSRSRSPRRRGDDDRDQRRREQLEPRRDRDRDRDRERGIDSRENLGKREKTPRTSGGKMAAATTTTTPQQPMILVTINDRLGTKKQIPCFPTDTVRDFKMIVASMIGRQPHEILLKRQGERPFKDILTLQDYGVSHNVQLDLEVDTGD